MRVLLTTLLFSTTILCFSQYPYTPPLQNHNPPNFKPLTFPIHTYSFNHSSGIANARLDISKTLNLKDQKIIYDSISVISKTLRNNKDSVELYLKRASFYQQLHKFSNAEYDLEKVYRLSGEKNPIIYLMLGKGHAYEGNIKKALNYFLKYNTLVPDDTEGYYWAARSALASSNSSHPDWHVDYQTAKIKLDQLIELDTLSDFSTRLKIADIYNQMNKPAVSLAIIEFIEEHYTVEKNNLALLEIKANAYLKKDKSKEACDTYSHLLSLIDPDDFRYKGIKKKVEKICE